MDDSLIYIIGAVFLIVVVVVLFIVIMGRKKDGGAGGGKQGSKRKDARVRDANKRLTINPLDPEALNTIGGVYYEEGAWDKAVKTYETLSDILLREPVPGVDKFEAFFRFGTSAIKLNLSDQAYRGFSAARTVKQDNFEVNYNLGALEFERKNYEKAIQLLQLARNQNPDNPAVLRCLGHSFFRLKKPKEAMSFIRKAIDLAPDDKESLYTLAECYYEANQIDQALKIFSHLRADPIMGPSACLISGNIHNEVRRADLAIQDYEMGLKHENIKPDTLAELRYYLAVSYIKINEISKALPLLHSLQSDNPSYKDVNVLIGKYQELNANKNLQIFLMASSADFVALCRKIVMTYFAKAKVKILNISVHKNEWADILAEVNTPKWSDVIMFRFIRTQGSIGELIVRDFHSHLKDVKAGKGVCMTVGVFSEEAKRYTEARLIDLIEKERLAVIMNTVDAKAAALANVKKK
jgi:tetratricopeptide (TPR) repeat protein